MVDWVWLKRANYVCSNLSISTTKTMTTAQLLQNIPDDVSIQILARIPTCYHPTLSLVSKSWQSLFKSPLIHTIRLQLLKSTINHFSLFLTIRFNSMLHFYSSNKRTLSALPLIPSHPVGSAFASLGHKIYVIGGSVADKPSNSLWVFDCRFNRWELGPKMRVCREFAAAGVADGKIYVMGGCVVDNWARSAYWAEAFDPLEGSWAAVPSPIESRDKWMHASAVVDGKVYAMADRGGVVYDVAKREWGGVGVGLDSGWRGRAAVVDGILYCYDYLGKIRGYDVVGDKWKELRGVNKGLPKFLCGATMADLGGNLCVVWEAKGTETEMEIMCAEIEVCKNEYGVLNGSIIWCDVILKVPNRASIVSCFGVKL